MKKIFAAVLAIVLLAATCSTAFAKATYDPEKPYFVIVACDEETGETYVTEIGLKTTIKRIKANLVYEVYFIEADGLVPLDFEIVEDDVVFTNKLTKEPLEL